MRRSLACLGALVVFAGCASYPVPVQRMADAEAANRAAEDVGARSDPRAQAHLRLAQRELARSRELVSNGDNERAATLLLRSKADADLALELARESQADADAVRATNGAAAAQAATNATHTNATPVTGVTTTTTTTGITTTTGATQPAPPAAAPQGEPK
ncbi:MAG TPA: hypothetical protein VGI39_04530 [Polyangiaceae bacterium]|jgi:hypothetical protein